MSTVSSSHYASAAASGENWRDISQKVLEQLQALRTDGFKPNIGFLYITDALAGDAASIVTLFRSVTGIEHWTGCAALGVCAHNAEYVDVPAISVLIGQIPPDNFRPFQAQAPRFKKLHQELEPWLNKNDPMLVVIHAAPTMDDHPAQAIEEIDAMAGGFMVGGLASSRTGQALFGRDVASAGVGGFIFSEKVAVSTALSQGCVPMGPLHEISRADDRVIGFLDGRTPFEVFSEDLLAAARQRLGYQPEGRADLPPSPTELLRLLGGQAHIALPVIGTDLRDFMVRNILAIDADTGMIAVAEHLEDGQKIMFVLRNDETVRSDLSSMLVGLRKRVEQEQGRFAPKAALYVSCVARTSVPFPGNKAAGGEMALIRDILGDIPVTGFYANGEISNNRLYGYTGVMTLFL